MLSMGKILALFLVVAVIFGYKKLPELGKGLGEGIRNFRKGISEPGEIDITPRAKEDKAGQDPPKQANVDSGPTEQQTATPLKKPTPLRRPTPGGKAR